MPYLHTRVNHYSEISWSDCKDPFHDTDLWMMNDEDFWGEIFWAETEEKTFARWLSNKRV
jgi:hypothetical protein